MPLNETDLEQDQLPGSQPESADNEVSGNNDSSTEQRAHRSQNTLPLRQERRRWWRRWATNPRTILRTILMLDDTPRSIALGTTVGMFIGMTPTVGIQMILVMIFAVLTSRLLQFNRVAALLTVYISNPLTVVPIYWIDYKVGTLFVGGNFTREDLKAILDYNGLAGWWQTIKTLFIEVGEPLILGSLVVASVFAAVTYPTILWLVRRFRAQGAI